MSKLSGARILVAEDDVAFLSVLSAALRRKGALVTEASDGEEAHRLFLEQNFDFILSDIQMPVMTGIELLKNVRTRNSTIPIFLLITGQSDITEAESLRLGAAALVRKPFRLDQLIPLIERFVAA